MNEFDILNLSVFMVEFNLITPQLMISNIVLFICKILGDPFYLKVKLDFHHMTFELMRLS